MIGTAPRIGTLAAAAVALGAIAGCGASPDFGGSQRSSGGYDAGLSGGYGSYGSSGTRSREGEQAHDRGAYPRVEVTFELPDLRGNPYDYAENDVEVAFQSADGRSVRVPAFFDGGKTWRARCTPDSPGRVTVRSITVNRTPAQNAHAEPAEADVSGAPTPGFVRQDAQARGRLTRDNGASYVALGIDDPQGDAAQAVQAAAASGGNWAQVRMRPIPGAAAPKPGEFAPETARHWDEVIATAEKAGVALHLALHEGAPLSTRTESQWAKHPWNRANGGWLTTPDEFFTNPRAIALTRARLRYAIARWGYSTAIAAWDLMDGIDQTDAIRHRHADEVAAWHRAMADFVRQQDPYRHLIATGAGPQLSGQLQGVDLTVERIAGPDIAGQIAALALRGRGHPVLISAAAASGGSDGSAAAHQAIWSGLAGEAAGIVVGPGAAGGKHAALASAAEFLRKAGIGAHRGLARMDAPVDTPERATLVLRPGGAPLPAKRLEWSVAPSGAVEGIAQMPSILPGGADRARFRSATFKVSCATAGAFTVDVGRVAREGAEVSISVDGGAPVTKAFPAAAADTDANASVQAPVPAGAHTVRIENSGAGWLSMTALRITGCAPALATLGRADRTYAVQWVFRRDAADGAAPIKGSMRVPGLQPGAYRATWWDTAAGSEIATEPVEVDRSGSVSIPTPAVARDVALFVERVSSAATAGKKAAAPKHAAAPDATQRPGARTKRPLGLR